MIGRVIYSLFEGGTWRGVYSNLVASEGLFYGGYAKAEFFL